MAVAKTFFNGPNIGGTKEALKVQFFSFLSRKFQKFSLESWWKEKWGRRNRGREGEGGTEGGRGKEEEIEGKVRGSERGGEGGKEEEKEGREMVKRWKLFNFSSKNFRSLKEGDYQKKICFSAYGPEKEEINKNVERVYLVKDCIILIPSLTDWLKSENRKVKKGERRKNNIKKVKCEEPSFLLLLLLIKKIKRVGELGER